MKCQILMLGIPQSTSPAEPQKLDSWIGHRNDSFCGESTSTPGLKVFGFKFGFSVWQMQWICSLHCRFRLRVSWWNPYIKTIKWPYLKYSNALLYLRSFWFEMFTPQQRSQVLLVADLKNPSSWHFQVGQVVIFSVSSGDPPGILEVSPEVFQWSPT